MDAAAFPGVRRFRGLSGLYEAKYIYMTVPLSFFFPSSLMRRDYDTPSSSYTSYDNNISPPSI